MPERVPQSLELAPRAESKLPFAEAGSPGCGRDALPADHRLLGLKGHFHRSKVKARGWETEKGEISTYPTT